MAPRSELTPAIRERICELYAIGWGYKRIHQRYQQVLLSTVRYTIKKEPERKNGVLKSRSGRSTKLNLAEKVCLFEVITENLKITYEDLFAKVSYKVKKELI